jgi:DNA mismatch repair protein MutS2
LNDASLGNLEEIRIVHGKGTGILRQAVREYLDGHPLVINWASDEGPAGNGVTIVWLS